MKLVSCLGIMWALLLGMLPAAERKLERVILYGVSYVRLEDWADTFKFQLTWVAPQQVVRASTKWSALEFTVNSRKMVVNGVGVWLGAPVALYRGAAYVGAADLGNTVNPLLFPARTTGGKKVKTIYLDPGHGGKDTGYLDKSGYEKTYTLLLAKEVSRRLNKAGYKVYMTRTLDTTLDREMRPALAKRRQADLFISLHFNAASGPGSEAVSGLETYCMTPVHATSTNSGGEGAEHNQSPGNRLDSHNILLAYQIHKAMNKNLGGVDRGVRRARFDVLRLAEMPAVLVEGGFLTNPSEARKIRDREYRRRMAQAIVEGVQAYKKIVERNNA